MKWYALALPALGLAKDIYTGLQDGRITEAELEGILDGVVEILRRLALGGIAVPGELLEVDTENLASLLMPLLVELLDEDREAMWDGEGGIGDWISRLMHDVRLGASMDLDYGSLNIEGLEWISDEDLELHPSAEEIARRCAGYWIAVAMDRSHDGSGRSEAAQLQVCSVTAARELKQLGIHPAVMDDAWDDELLHLAELRERVAAARAQEPTSRIKRRLHRAKILSGSPIQGE